MPYVVRCITKFSDIDYSITLKALHENGEYYGYVRVLPYEIGFSIKGQIDENDKNILYNAICFFEKNPCLNYSIPTVCWIARYPIEDNEVFFYYSANLIYGDEHTRHYKQLTETINRVFGQMVKNKAAKYVSPE